MSLPEYATGQELAELLGVTDRRVRQMHASKIIRQVDGRKYPLRESVQAYLAFVRQSGHDADPADPTAPLDDKARKLRAEADLAEMEAERERKRLVPALILSAAVQAQDIGVKDRLLAVPMSAADRAYEAGLDGGAAGIAEVYRLEIRDALADLSSADLVSSAAH